MWSGCRPICSSKLPALSTVAVPSDSLVLGRFSNNWCDASWATDEQREEDVLSILSVHSALRFAMALRADMLGVVWVGYMVRSSNSPECSRSLKAWWLWPWPKTGPDVLSYDDNSRWTWVAHSHTFAAAQPIKKWNQEDVWVVENTCMFACSGFWVYRAELDHALNVNTRHWKAATSCTRSERMTLIHQQGVRKANSCNECINIYNAWRTAAAVAALLHSHSFPHWKMVDNMTSISDWPHSRVVDIAWDVFNKIGCVIASCRYINFNAWWKSASTAHILTSNLFCQCTTELEENIFVSFNLVLVLQQKLLSMTWVQLQLYLGFRATATTKSKSAGGP